MTLRYVLLLCSTLLVAADRPPAAVQTVVRTAGDSAAVSQYFVVLPHLAYGGTWRTKIVITNTSNVPANITVNYYGSSGAAQDLPFGGVLADHTDLIIPANGAREIEPDWQGPDATAWAGLVYTDTGLKIQGVFLWHNPADPPDKYTEAAAPIISQIVSQTAPYCLILLPVPGLPLPGGRNFSMPYDETDGRFSGYAFANTMNAPATMTLTFYDQDGAVVGQYSEPLAGFGHNQFLLKDKVPGVAGKKGQMQISGAGIVPLGFRFTPQYSFTTWQP